MRKLSLFGIGALLILSIYLLRPAGELPRSAEVACLSSAGQFQRFGAPPPAVYGMGLMYAGHIRETGSRMLPGELPPVFRKAKAALQAYGDSDLVLPDAAAVAAALEVVEPGLGAELQQGQGELAPLVDYEVELGLVLLEAVSVAQLQRPDFVPKLGYFVANDFTARSVAVMGEGQVNRLDYWAAAKSFPGFLAMSEHYWQPRHSDVNSALCITLSTWVNSELRQRAPTTELLYRPRQILALVLQHNSLKSLEAGTLILTGTPSGVAIQTPLWQSRLAALLGLDRYSKLTALQRRRGFLAAGDEVVVEAEWLGVVRTRVRPPQLASSLVSDITTEN